VFGRTMLLFLLEKLRVYNILFLATVPIGTAFLVVCQRLAAMHEWGVWRIDLGFEWLRFWAVLVLTIVAQTIFVHIHLMWNPYVSPLLFACSTWLILSAQIVYSSPYIVALLALSLTFLILSFPLSTSLPQIFHCCPLEDKSTTTSVLLQLHILSYILLLLPTTLLPTPLSGTYLLTFLATCIFVGWAVGIIRQLVLNQPREPASTSGSLEEQTEEEEKEGRSRVRFEPLLPARVTFVEAAAMEPLNRALTSAVDVEPMETTPLIARPHHWRWRVMRIFGCRERGSQWMDKMDEHGCEIIWVLQMLLVVLLPVILFAHIGVLLVGSTSQTVVDGGPVWIGEWCFHVLFL
jgi:hypothetical protein